MDIKGLGIVRGIDAPPTPKLIRSHYYLYIGGYAAFGVIPDRIGDNTGAQPQSDRLGYVKEYGNAAAPAGGRTDDPSIAPERPGERVNGLRCVW
jgi:hypothetical protein